MRGDPLGARAIDRNRLLLDFVLRAVADDYESFELVVEQATEWSKKRGFVPSRAEIAGALRRRILEKYIQSYLLSPHLPYSQKVEFDPGRIGELWFYLTPKGKNLVSSLVKLWA